MAKDEGTKESCCRDEDAWVYIISRTVLERPVGYQTNILSE